ncbi:TPA_asm: hypothetical protein GNC57_004902, partial [Salmonella enterica subsp. salamae serovar 48:d:z6]|nr:hypothetical protein [Salmonella enterica subsp. salamae serovar 48:d:z6]HAE7840853.1 hypothetical protein [Salmonella enterica subsp. salamae serovar 48:d:z6]
MTVSSAGSAATASNTLNVNGGLGYKAFKKLQEAGIDNNTSVIVTPDSSDLQDMGFSTSGDWTFNASTVGAAAEGKKGTWGLTFNNVSANTTGNISLTGMNMTNSSLTGGNVSLNGGGNTGLTVKNTTLNATSGNVSLNTTNGTLTVSNVNLSSVGGTTLSGTSLDNGTGVKLSGAVNVTQGNLTVNGTVNRTGETNVRGIDARDATINVSGNDAVLNMTGKVASDSGNGSVNVVGLDLSGNSTLNAHTANLTGISNKNGYGFLLNSTLQGGLTTSGSLNLSSKGSGEGVSNQIGSRVKADVVKHMIEQNVSIGSYTDTTITNLYNQANFTQWIQAGNGNLTKDFGDFGLKFSGINISAGSINLTGTSFTNSNLTASSGDLTINNKVGTLGLSNTSLNASAGNISLTGGSISLTGGQDVTAGKNITLNASKGGVNITGPKGDMKDITSASGNISINGNSVGFNRDGVLMSNVMLNASKGKINVTGVSDGSDYFLKGGVKFTDTVNLTSQSNTINGTHQQGSSDANFAGVVIYTGNYHFNGNTTINAVSDGYAGLAFNAPSYDQKGINVTFSDGNSVIHAVNKEEGDKVNIGGIAFDAWTNKKTVVNVTTTNGKLDISGEAKTREGIVSTSLLGVILSPDEISRGSGFVFTGDGDVNVKGISESSTGVDMRLFDNTGMTGKFTITGESKTGNGVAVPQFGNISLVNATITGSSESGAGILMNAGDKYIKKINLNGNTLIGTSASGAGIDIHGNNVSITNGTLNGTSGGNGAGVHLSGGSNYTVSNATISGQSVGGDAVGVDGNLTMKDSTLSGNTVDGNGVSVSGNVNTTNTTVTGNATG